MGYYFLVGLKEGIADADRNIVRAGNNSNIKNQFSTVFKCMILYIISIPCVLIWEVMLSFSLWPVFSPMLLSFLLCPFCAFELAFSARM